MTRGGYLGLGSNLGERRANLQAAVEELARREVDVLASSATYDTDPVGEVLDQPDFLNACLRVSTCHEPEQLLDVAKEVEWAVGRAPGARRHGPRIVDVDVLLLDGTTYSSERLRLPHPEVLSRRFVLVPLLELDPELTLPDGRRAADALPALGTTQPVRFAGAPLTVGRARRPRTRPTARCSRP